MAKKRKKGRGLGKGRGLRKSPKRIKANRVGRDSPPPAGKGWRATLPIHPAAELFPLMSPAELKDLAEDLRKSGGMNVPVALWRKDLDSPLQLLDGRNRLDALGRILVEPLTAEIIAAKFAQLIEPSVDPYAYVVSANIKRRHLTAKQKREIVATLLKARPETSDRQIAATVKVDNKTVASVRADQEGREEIPRVETRVDTKGRGQPARKRRRKRNIVISAGGIDLPCCAETPQGGDDGPRLIRNEEIEIAEAFTFLISMIRSLALRDLPRDVRPSDLRELAERISKLAAEVEATRAEETVR